MDISIAVNTLIDEEHVIITDFFSTGLSVLKTLKYHIEQQFDMTIFKEQREARSAYQKASNRLLLLVSNHKLKVRKSPEIGWFKELYNDLDEFLLPFPKIQGLNSAWQWYKKGIAIPVLKQKLHPYYDTYFPTRFEHLTLFDDWLKTTRSAKNTAFDIGVGSGVLTLLLKEHHFKSIIATDINPNAIVGMQQSIDLSNIELRLGNLFAKSDKKVDLIVFNPPWIPATHHLEGIDNAIYYGDNLFNDFFEKAKERLNHNGRVVLLFSNLAQVTGVTEINPIEQELLNHNRFEKDILLTNTVKKASKHTKRQQSWRKEELVELWVLKVKI